MNSLKRSPATVFIRNSDDIGKLVLRLALGAILLFRGVYKVTHGVEWIKPRLVQVGLPGLVAYGTYLAEVVSPLLLIVGYRVRLAALIIAVLGALLPASWAARARPATALRAE